MPKSQKSKKELEPLTFKDERQEGIPCATKDCYYFDDLCECCTGELKNGDPLESICVKYTPRHKE